MAQWSALTDHLSSADDTCALTWHELEAMVGDLPPSASHHRAWWSGDRPQVRAWKAAGFRLADVSLGHEVTFVRQTSPQPATAKPPLDLRFDTDERLEVETRSAAYDIVLISCSKTKLDHAATARELYDSPLFRQSRAYAVASGRPWFILSAEHGLVGPDEWLAPYERYLPDTPRSFRDAWGHWVVERLDLLVGGLTGRTVEIHAGAAYVEPIADRLRAKGCGLSLPLDGLSLGARRHWYAVRAGSATEPSGVIDPGRNTQANHDQSTAAFAALLRKETKALPPADFLARGPAGLKVPGLYSWWADEQAARDLSVGLGHTVEPGMIYAGLAGATRWPSGKQSSNTLWSRIAGMHLGKRHEFSTFRRTLGAVQAHRQNSATVDEHALTDWMTARLRVLAAPYEDADTLGRLETEVLHLLDPPLNLQGMPATPLRRRLTELRRVVSREAKTT